MTNLDSRDAFFVFDLTLKYFLSTVDGHTYITRHRMGKIIDKVVELVRRGDLVFSFEFFVSERGIPSAMLCIIDTTATSLSLETF